MNRTRDFRRAQRDRRRAAAARALAAHWTSCWRDMDSDERELAIRAHTDNRTVCSCWMCGNPRKHFGERTRAEVLADVEMADGIGDAV